LSKKEKNTKKKNSGHISYRFSLRKQITLVFVMVMAFAIAGTLVVNNVFLESYYVNAKEKAVMNAYSAIKTACDNGELDSEEFDLELQRYSANHNVSIMIITQSLNPLKIYSVEPQEQIILEFERNLRGSIQAKRIIKQSDDYILVQRSDSRFQTDYLEMWGILPDDSFFMLRTGIESLKISADIANRFLLYVGLGAIVICAVAIYLITRRISKPILELASISEKMSDMDFSEKYNGKSKTEIAVLGNSINTMSSNLEKAIEDLKKANAELQKDNELKTQIDEMRKEFISNVSHELKTPIALIQGYAEGLKEGINEAEERDYYCDVIIDESAKMNLMVKKLLTLNHLESGSDILQLDEFNLSLLIKNYVQSAAIMTEQKNILVNVDVPDECFVNADEFKIEEVFMNYFSNAINHCASDIQKRIDVKLEKEENKVRVSVFNTGKSIPEESIDRLWEKFYKVDKARTREYGGSGVGLSIVKAIMEAHHGEYGVANVSEGVCFWFTLTI